MFFSQFKNNNAASLFYIQIDKQHCLAIIMMHPEHHHANRNENLLHRDHMVLYGGGWGCHQAK